MEATAETYVTGRLSAHIPVLSRWFKTTLNNMMQHTLPLRYVLVQRGVSGSSAHSSSHATCHTLTNTIWQPQTGCQSGDSNGSKLQPSSLKSLLTRAPGGHLLFQKQPTAEARSQPKGGCRMQEQQDRHKLALMKIQLWRSKWAS